MQIELRLCFSVDHNINIKSNDFKIFLSRQFLQQSMLPKEV